MGNYSGPTLTIPQIEMVLNNLGLDYQDKGDHYVMRSPFRNDHHPDLWVYKSGYTIDYAGSFRGSMFAFFRALTGRSLMKAMPELGLEAGNVIWWKSFKIPANDTTPAVKKTHAVIFEEARIVPVYEDAPALRYCLSRGMTDEMIERWDVSFARRARFRGADAPSPGMLISRRLLIPIREAGETWSVEARDLLSKEERAQLPPEDRENYKKVLYPKGCSVDTLFGVDDLDFSQPIAVTEGLMDLPNTIRAHKNSTCTFGIQVSAHQAKLLNRFPRVILIPDPDEGGDTFVRIMSDLLENELWVAHVDEDPKHLKIDDIKRAIDEARPWIETAIDRSALFAKEQLLW